MIPQSVMHALDYYDIKYSATYPSNIHEYTFNLTLVFIISRRRHHAGLLVSDFV